MDERGTRERERERENTFTLQPASPLLTTRETNCTQSVARGDRWDGLVSQEFYDVNVWDKTRPQIYEELVQIAASFLEPKDLEAIRGLLNLQKIEGAKNPGTHVIQVRTVSQALYPLSTT
jgi:hypothetical protein